MNNQPFHVGQWVVAVDAIHGSTIKNGQVYQILSCDTARLPDGSNYHYVGVNGSHNRLRPSIFAPLNLQEMTFEKMVEEQPIYQS